MFPTNISRLPILGRFAILEVVESLKIGVDV
jgi:hypothetical protein